MKSVRIRSFSDPYSVRMRKRTDQKNSQYGFFSRSTKGKNKETLAYNGLSACLQGFKVIQMSMWKSFILMTNARLSNSSTFVIRTWFILCSKDFATGTKNKDGNFAFTK